MKAGNPDGEMLVFCLYCTGCSLPSAFAGEGLTDPSCRLDIASLMIPEPRMRSMTML